MHDSDVEAELHYIAKDFGPYTKQNSIVISHTADASTAPTLSLCLLENMHIIVQHSNAGFTVGNQHHACL